MKNTIIFLLFISIFVSAEECQYLDKSIIVDSVSKRMLFDNQGNLLKEPIYTCEKCGWDVHAELSNPNPVAIKVEVKVFTEFHKCVDTPRISSLIATVPAGSSIQLPAPSNPNQSCSWTLSRSDYEFVYHDSEESKAKIHTVNTYKCKGKNDGETCNTDFECGSNYCIQNQCYSKNEAQIIEAEQAIQKKIDDGNTLIFVILGTGTFLLLLFVVIVAGAMFFYLENKSLDIKNKQIELEQMREEIDILKKKQNKKKKEIEKLTDFEKEYSKKMDALKATIRNEWQRISIPFPYTPIGNRLAIINPYLGGYMCFYKKEIKLEDYDTGTLIHRWIWKKYNGRWPRPEYHIHHKDHDKYNNDISNLEEIEGKEHIGLHRNGLGEKKK